MGKIILAGIVGGIVWFIWGAVAHMVLQVGVDGIEKLDEAQENKAMAALMEGFSESGQYYVPWIDPTTTDEKLLEAYEKKHEKGPVALVLLHRDGAPVMPPSMFVKEFITNVLAALIVACMAGMMAGGYLKRAFAIGGFGAVGWLSISASDHIWMRFPVETLKGEGIEQILGWLIVGFIIAKIVPAAGAQS